MAGLFTDQARLGLWLEVEILAVEAWASLGVVPEEVRTRVSKAGPGEALQRALVREWPRLSGWLADPLVAEHGWVDREAFRATLERARHGVTTHAGQLRKTLSLEIWLRTLQSGETAASLEPTLSAA